MKTGNVKTGNMKTGNMKTICYDISSLIRKKLELKKCPSCQANLMRCPVEHSQASSAFVQKASAPVISTFLSRCPDCGWWAIRELWADDELYDPPVEEFIVVGAAKKGAIKPVDDAAPWEQILVDQAHWKNPVLIQSTDAIALFGSAQMLLPNINTLSRHAVFDRIKSVAPILFPILIVIGIAFFF